MSVKPCKFYAQGKCKYGNKCSFAHNNSNNNNNNSAHSFSSPDTLDSKTRAIREDINDYKQKKFQTRPFLSSYGLGYPAVNNLISGRDISFEEQRLQYIEAQAQNKVAEHEKMLMARVNDMDHCVGQLSGREQIAARYQQRAAENPNSLPKPFIESSVEDNINKYLTQPTGFGSNATSSGAFGLQSSNNMTNNASSSPFGNSGISGSTSGFGASGFGGSGFGSSGGSNSGFGASGFGGSGFGKPPPTNSGFGSSAFGSSSFGKPNTTSSGFGTSGFGASGFGSSNTSGGSSAFGKTGFDSSGTGSSWDKSNTGSAFGSSGFGSSGTKSTGFGSTGTGTSAFGSAGFGSSGFGGSGFGNKPDVSSGFGSSALGATSATSNGFGSSGSPFGNASSNTNNSPFGSLNTSNNTSSPFGGASTSNNNANSNFGSGSSPFASLQGGQPQLSNNNQGQKSSPLGAFNNGTSNKALSTATAFGSAPNAASNTVPSQPSDSLANNDAELDEMNPEVVAAFRAAKFELGRVPEIPPPLALC